VASAAIEPNRAAVRRSGAEHDTFQTSVLHHCLDLQTRESLFEACSQPVEGVVAYDVERSVSIVRERERIHGQSASGEQSGEPGKGPVNNCRDGIACDKLCPGGKTGHSR
jgi:hypothetical protein